ncbi:MAG: hypothetical protein ACREO7_04170 [Pseudoxanthomonas sp.]
MKETRSNCGFPVVVSGSKGNTTPTHLKVRGDARSGRLGSGHPQSKYERHDGDSEPQQHQH